MYFWVLDPNRKYVLTILESYLNSIYLVDLARLSLHSLHMIHLSIVWHVLNEGTQFEIQTLLTIGRTSRGIQILNRWLCCLESGMDHKGRRPPQILKRLFFANRVWLEPDSSVWPKSTDVFLCLKTMDKNKAAHIYLAVWLIGSLQENLKRKLEQLNWLLLSKSFFRSFAKINSSEQISYKM